MPNTFFTADAHWSHDNIRKYANRPFATIEEMNVAMITNWNNVVAKSDTVYFLGDFCFNRSSAIANTRDIRRQLNGNICFIRGNHDKDVDKYKDCFSWTKDVAMVRVGEQDIFLSHYAHRVWPSSHYGTWHLYGHSHGSLMDDPHSLSFDVGVDCHNYTPVSFDQVKAIMAKKFYVPVDHHQPKVRLEGGGVGLNKDDYAKLLRRQQYEMLKKEFDGS